MSQSKQQKNKSSPVPTSMQFTSTFTRGHRKAWIGLRLSVSRHQDLPSQSSCIHSGPPPIHALHGTDQNRLFETANLITLQPPSPSPPLQPSMFSHCLWQSLPGPAVLPRPLPDPRCSSHTGQAVLFITWALHLLLSGTRGLTHALPNFKDEESVSCKGVSINSTSPEGFLGAENATFPRGGGGGGVGKRMTLGETEATDSLTRNARAKRPWKPVKILQSV